jgi:hypothetical protein
LASPVHLRCPPRRNRADCDSMSRAAGFQVVGRKRWERAHLMPAARSREISGFNHLSATFCPAWAPAAGATAVAALACIHREWFADSILGPQSHGLDSAFLLTIRCRHRVIPGRAPHIAVPWGRHGAGWRYSKISNQNSTLQENSDHAPVLFVQHPLEKGRSEAARSGSFIACAEVLGNCDDATEGGIPRSSR